MVSTPLVGLSRFRILLGAIAFFAVAGLVVGCGGDDVDDDAGFEVGGIATGVDDGGLILQNNGADDLAVEEDGFFVFETELEDGDSYDVTVLQTPTDHDCEVSAGSGTIDGASVSDVAVDCEESGQVDPEDEPFFFVSIDLGESTLQTDIGGVIVIEAEVENSGDAIGVQDINFEVDGTVHDSVSGLELDVGESETMTFEWDTTGVEEGTYNAEVNSDDDLATASLTVFALTEHFEVSIDETESQLHVDEGDPVFVHALIENTGDETGTQNINFEVPGKVSEVEANIELDVGDTETVIFEWDTEVGDAGDYVVEVHSSDDVATADVTVDELPMPYFSVSIDEGESVLDVEEGETAVIEAEIENTGDETGIQDIVLEVDGMVVASETDIELDIGDTEDVVFHWDAAPGSEGVYTASVISDDDSDTAEITVDRPTGIALFAVSIDEEESDLVVDEGDPVTIVVEVDNRGDTTGTQNIVLEIDGDQEGIEEDLELDGEEVQELSFEWPTSADDAGIYTAEVMSDDDIDSAQIGVIDPDGEATLSGTVVDVETNEGMEDVEVVLIDADSGDEVASGFADDSGAYEIDEVDTGVYTIILQAPGLEPNHSIDEAYGANSIDVILVGGEASQDMTVDWLRTTDLIIDGGMIDLQYNDPDGDLEVELPGCEQQPDGSWEPEEVDEEGVEVTLTPEGECFQVNNVGIDLATGEFDVTVADILFPDITIFVEDFDAGGMGDFIDGVEADLDWLFDDIGGSVDFTDGSMNVDFDVRLLFGATVHSAFMDVDIGAREGHMDCQMVRSWGGDIANPTEDTDGLQIGDYLHDPLELRMTTGESGPNDVSGEPYDAVDRFFVNVDNNFDVDRFSEGSYGNDDPGGSSCGDIDMMGFQEDFGALFNDFLELPADPGSVYMEFDFLLP